MLVKNKYRTFVRNFAYIHTHTYAHIHIYAYTHIYIYAYTHIQRGGYSSPGGEHGFLALDPGVAFLPRSVADLPQRRVVAGIPRGCGLCADFVLRCTMDFAAVRQGFCCIAQWVIGAVRIGSGLVWTKPVRGKIRGRYLTLVARQNGFEFIRAKSNTDKIALQVNRDISITKSHCATICIARLNRVQVRAKSPNALISRRISIRRQSRLTDFRPRQSTRPVRARARFPTPPQTRPARTHSRP